MSAKRTESKSGSTKTNIQTTPAPDSAGDLGSGAGVPRFLQRSAVTVHASDDPYEREAERVADQATPAPVQRCACGGNAGADGECAACRAQRLTIQRKSEASGEGMTASSSILPTGSGQPLSPALRASFEPRFGQDFSSVRLHTDAQAATQAKEVQAHAFTAGHDIVFGAGQYAPETPGGQRLLAHELTHVVQQGKQGHDGEPSIQRQPNDEKKQETPLAAPFEVEYEAYDPYAEERQSSIYPAMSVATPQALGYWTHPPGSGFSQYFMPAWARKMSFAEPLGQQPNGDWLLERYAGTSSYDPRSPRTSSRLKEFFGFGMRKELSPRSSLRAEQGSSFARYTKMTPAEIASIPDILRRVNSGGKFSFTEAELTLLQRAATAHGDSGMTGGSPFLSTTSKPGLSTEFEMTPKKFLSGRPYVVRVRVPNSAVLEMNKMPKRISTLIPEQEMLVTTDLRGRIVAVQPNPTSSLARGEPYMRWGGRAMLAFGLGVSAYRIATASEEDRGMVVMQEVASQAGGIGGAGVGAAGCVAFGIGSGGVVLFACGLVGAFLGAEAANNLVMMPFMYADVLANQLPYAMLQAAEGFEAVGKVAGALPAAIAGGPVRAHALMDPGNWDMRYFSPAIAPDVAAVGVAMWERLGPLQIDDFLQEVNKPVGSFGVPVTSARRIAAFLSGPGQQYNANMPALYASLGPTLPPSPAEPGVNILEMKPYELIPLLAARKLNFIQDPDYLGGFAGRLESNPMLELRLRLLIEQRERIAEDNWSFPGKSHEQVRALRLVGQYAWNALKGLDEQEFGQNANRKLATFGISDWTFKDAARASDELSNLSQPLTDLTENERTQRSEILAELARQIGDMTPEEYAYWLMANAGLVPVHDPTAASYAAIKRVREGYQPW